MSASSLVPTGLVIIARLSRAQKNNLLLPLYSSVFLCTHARFTCICRGLTSTVTRGRCAPLHAVPRPSLLRSPLLCALSTHCTYCTLAQPAPRQAASQGNRLASGEYLALLVVGRLRCACTFRPPTGPACIEGTASLTARPCFRPSPRSSVLAPRRISTPSDPQRRLLRCSPHQTSRPHDPKLPSPASRRHPRPLHPPAPSPAPRLRPEPSRGLRAGCHTSRGRPV